MTDALIWAFAILSVALGLAGTVLPALPGPILVFAGISLAAWADDFTRIGIVTLVLIAGMTAAAHVVDLVSSALGVRRAGASARAVVGASLGILAGFFFGLPGLLIGPFVGATLGELSLRRDLQQASRAGFAAWLGFIVGTAAKVSLVIATIGVAAAAYFL
jgi:uncharacterized protein YqgC (DUF456 family)